MKLHLELTSSLLWQLPQNSWCDELTSDHELGDIVWNCGLLHHNGWQLRFVTDKPLYAMSAGFSLAGTYLHGSGFVCVCICPTRLATNDLYTWLRLHIQQSTFILSLLNLTAEISIPSTGDTEFARLSARTAAINSRRGMLTDSNGATFVFAQMRFHDTISPSYVGYIWLMLLWHRHLLMHQKTHAVL